MITIDEAVGALGRKPVLIKIDVEGFEARVLRGADQLLNSGEPPAICFEWNPVTMGELRTSPDELLRLLRSYHLYYIDDFEGEKKTFGEEIADLELVDWVCNVFAVSRSKVGEWASAKSHTISELALHG
jgi:hypothetical protein